MRDDEHNDRTVHAWTVAADTRDVTPTDAAEAAVEDIQRRLCQDRLMGMWRTAVQATATCVKAEHQREAANDDGGPKKPPPWNMRAAWGVKRAA